MTRISYHVNFKPEIELAENTISSWSKTCKGWSKRGSIELILLPEG